VGTSAGGLIPSAPPKTPNQPVEPPIRSTLDREIANRIIDAARRRAGSRGLQVGTEELYWRFLAVAAVLLAIGLLFMQERIERMLQAAGAGVALVLVWTLTR
jgi:hypothetical protein